VEHRGVVVIAEVGVLQHPLQVADDRRRAQVGSASRDERLVHVQGDGEGAVDARDVHRRPTADHRLARLAATAASTSCSEPHRFGRPST
jgi:hypothetical protein